MAGDLNNYTAIGRLTRDPELKYSAGGTAIMKGSLAINRRVKKGEQWIDEATFIDFDFLGKGAEAVHKYLTKGKQIGITGEIKQERWEKDGQKHSKILIHVTSLQMLGENNRQASGEQPASSGEQFDDDVPF